MSAGAATATGMYKIIAYYHIILQPVRHWRAKVIVPERFALWARTLK